MLYVTFLDLAKLDATIVCCPKTLKTPTYTCNIQRMGVS